MIDFSFWIGGLGWLAIVAIWLFMGWLGYLAIRWLNKKLD